VFRAADVPLANIMDVVFIILSPAVVLLAEHHRAAV
jgi:hypothetical protein